MQQSTNEELKNCIMQYKKRLQEILQRLEWSEEAVVKDFNTNSLASAVKDKVKKPHSPKVATYPDSCITKNSLVIETPKLQEILQNNEVKAPRNFTELQANLSREQKLKIYEHVVENTEKLENNTVAQVDAGEISLADILAQKKREEKRNKRKFRKPKPTHIEEVRCLVDLQMQALQQFVGNKMKKDEDNMQRSGRDERKHYEDYYKRDKYRDRYDNRRRDRYHSKEPKRYHRSRSKDISRKRKRRSRSHSKERRKSGPSSHKDIVHKRTNNSRSRSKEISREKRKHRSRSTDRRKPNRSSSKEVLNDKRKRSRSRNKYKKHSRSKEIAHKRTRRSRSHSKETAYKRTRDSESNEITNERVSQREECFYSKKHSSRRDYENTNEKRRYNEMLYRRHSKSPENSSSKTHSFEDKTKIIDYDEEYTSSHHSKKKHHGTSLDQDKYDRKSKSAYQSIEETSKYKSYQNKTVRDRS